jgi:RNA polymerase sigma-70 factor (ECF subfamily)
LRRLCRDAALADDLLQHTFLRLAERGPELRSDSNLKAWLFTVARNAFYDHARGEITGDAAALEEVFAPSPQLEAQLLLRDVEQALRELHPQDRELLLMIAEGFTPSELATVQRIDAAAVRQRLTRARSRLLAALQKQHDPQERERKSS